MFVTSKEACDQFHICKATLKSWKDSGRIKYKQFSPKKILYDTASILQQDRVEAVAIYSRVSNTKQASDLLRQETILREYAVSKGYSILESITDIGSGMNESRKGLSHLMTLVFDQKINKIVISYKDRLTRFGYGYFESIFKRFGVEIEIVNLTQEADFQQELSQDLISIIHHFSMKLYSNRRQLAKKFKQDLVASSETADCLNKTNDNNKTTDNIE